MLRLDLTFASKEDSLTVRTFTIREEMSSLFEVDLIARSPHDEIDLASIVGKGAVFRVATDALIGGPTTRIWNGICAQMDLLQAEPTGLSTYYIKIVPGFWRTTLRKNNRIFQHKTIPEIVQAVLTEWQIKPELKIQAAAYPKYEYKVQYNETDYAFISRLLEEAGIAFWFAYGDGKTAEEQTHLVLSDEPQKAPMRGGGPIQYVIDNSNKTSDHEWVSHVRLAQRVDPGHTTIRDYDFRTKPDYQLVQDFKVQSTDGEEKYEQYHYIPGSFLVEPGKGGDTPVADDKGIARVDEKFGKALATRSLESDRRDRLRVGMNTVCTDLWPGQILAIKDHPRKDLAPDKKLLVVEARYEGGAGEAMKISLSTVFCEPQYRPLKRTPKPRVIGVQSAMVVGAKGEEIHTDEFGRVRVQFHWDREGTYNDFSSCWIRVSQAWAGFSYGMIVIPRVGHEVLVDFFDGDPDQPIITGRVFNNTTRVPYKLPENKTKSGWKSDTSPGSNGFNELSFEDAKGRECIHIQAQKDFTEIIKNNQSSTVLNNRSASVTSNDSMTVGKNQSFDVDKNRMITVGENQVTNVGEVRLGVVGKTDVHEIGHTYLLNVGAGNGLLVAGDSKTIVLTTGQATIIMGPDTISMSAMGSINISAGGLLKLSGAEVDVDGGPNVYINTKGASGPSVMAFDPVSKPSEPAKPGSGGEGSEKAPILAGQGKVEKPMDFEEAAAGELPKTPAAAPAQIAMKADTVKAIADEVKASDPVKSVKDASKAFISKANISKAVEIAKAIKNAKATKGMSLLGVSEVKDAVAKIVTAPIIGKLDAVDIADVLNQAQTFGLIHMGKDGQAATAFIRGAAPDAPNKTTKFLGDVVTKPIIGDFSLSDVAGVIKQGEDAGLIKLGKDGVKVVDDIGAVTPEGTTNKLAEFLGKAATKPVAGDASLADVAGALSDLAGAKILNLGKGGTKAVKAIQTAASNAPKAADAATTGADAAKTGTDAAKTGTDPATDGASTGDAADPNAASDASGGGGGGSGGGGAKSAASLVSGGLSGGGAGAPSGGGATTPVLLMKTQTTPPKIDPEKMNAYAQALQKGGLPAHKAMLKAMADQGVVAYVGEADGTFNKATA